MKLKAPFDFQTIIFFTLLFVITVSFGYLLQPFFFALFWAALLAGIFSPLYRFFQRKFGRPNLSASLTFLIILLIIILPAGFIISLLLKESLDIYKTFNMESGQLIEKIKTAIGTLSNNSYVARFDLDESALIAKSTAILKSMTNYIFNNLTAYTQNTLLFLVQFAVMLYTLFYFLRDGKCFVSKVSEYLPIDENHFKTFIDQFSMTSKAALKFTLVIGGIQGTLGGLIFYITGIESSLIWGLLMVGLSIVPAFGCAIIWVPAGFIMLFTGHIWQGITILIFGILVISTIDNLLRPWLLGKDIQMHSLLIFLSTLGGIGLFGISGFVLGPLIASFFLASWDLFAKLYRYKEAN